jgi:vitamin B12 transporter
MSRYLTALLAAVAALPLSSTPGQDTTAVPLDTVVVSAGKAPAGSGTTTQATTVIHGFELRVRGITRLSDALRSLPGAFVAGGGAVGSVTSLFIRGGESRYAKVLVDGVAVNAAGGYFDFANLTTDNVDRIEIVRGPSSVVYGADAMTGVVHVFTRRGSGEPTVVTEARAGTYGTRDIVATAAGTSSRTQYSVGAARHATDGILPFNNHYRNDSWSGSLRHTSAPGTGAGLAVRYGTSRYHFPTDFTGVVEDSNSFRDQRRLTVGFDASRRFAERFDLAFLTGVSRITDVNDDVDPPPPWIGGSDDVHSRFTVRTSRRMAETRASYRFAQSLMTAGLEYGHENERSGSHQGPVGTQLPQISAFSGTRTTRVVFGELVGSAAPVEYVLSARVDDPSDFGTYGTYRLGVAAGGVLRLRASVGTAFNAPAFSQLLPTEYTVGSPDLRPERSRSFEIGTEWRPLGERFRMGATRFAQRFTDLIQFVSGGPPDWLGSFANLAAARSDGWELEARAVPMNGLVATASYTRLDARVTRLDGSYEGLLGVGQPLIRRPRHTSAATLTYAAWSRGTAALSVRRIGSRPDLDFREFPSPTVQLPAHTVVDAAIGVRPLRRGIGERLTLTLRAENLFDRDYEEVLYYRAPGRTILLGARAALPLR